MSESSGSDDAVALRPATEADEAFLLSVYASTRQQELEAVQWTAAQKAAFLAWQGAAQHRYYRQNYAGAEYAVIEAEGHPIGRLYLHRRSDEIRIMDIALLPPYRGRGVGTRLLRQVLDEGRRTGRSVSIHVEKDNPALRLYERLGFRRAADRGVYLFLEWRPDETG